VVYQLRPVAGRIPKRLWPEVIEPRANRQKPTERTRDNLSQSPDL
jgi:hypothetical protein